MAGVGETNLYLPLSICPFLSHNNVAGHRTPTAFGVGHVATELVPPLGDELRATSGSGSEDWNVLLFPESLAPPMRATKYVVGAEPLSGLEIFIREKATSI